jgi:hypothetical protein
MTRLVARERCPSWALSGLSSLRSLCRRPAYVRGSRTWLGLAWCGTSLGAARVPLNAFQHAWWARLYGRVGASPEHSKGGQHGDKQLRVLPGMTA